PRGLPVLALGVSPHAWGLRLRRVECGLALSTTLMLPSGYPDAVGTRKRLISELNTLPADALSHASSAASRPPSQGWGPGWLAMPSLYDSFIRYSLPVYPGAIQGFTLRQPTSQRADWE